MEIAAQNPPRRRLVPHDDVIQALAANRSDQSFHVRILPRRTRSCGYFFDPHALREGNECSSEDCISIPDPIPRRLVPRKRFSNLLRGPLFGRVFRHIKVHDSPSVMGENDEDEQHSEPSSRHGKEVHRRHLLHVVLQEWSPGLRWRPTVSTQMVSPPSSSYTGVPRALPMRSQRATSTPLMAYVTIPP